MYAVCFVAVAIVAKAATIVVGLPDWVMPASLGLMGLGLPIILITAYVQRVARRSVLATPRLTPGGGAVAAVDDADARAQGESVSVVATLGDGHRVGRSAASRCWSPCSWCFDRSASARSHR